MKKKFFTKYTVKKIWVNTWVQTILTTILFFIPIGQFYSAIIAFPLFLNSSIAQEGALMGYTFAYFYPKKPFVIFIFIIYYLLFFCLYECISIYFKNTKKVS